MAERAGAAPRLPSGFRGWVAAAAVSDAGVAALYVALGWAATSYGGTAAGLVVATITATRTLLLLVGGTVADRFGARVVMLIGDGLLLLITGVLAVAAVVLDTPLWLLFAAAAAEGLVSAFYLPASSSMTRRLVEPDLVGRASALRGATSEAAEVVGSPLGGLLVAAGGFGLAAGIDAFTYIPILIVMLVLRPRRVPEEEQVRQSLWRAAASGIVLVARHRVLRVAIGLTALAAGAVVAVATLLIPLVVRSNGWPPIYSGVLLAASSVSGIVVALVVSRLGTARRASVAATFGLLTTAAGLALLGASSSLPVAILAIFAAGGGVTVFTSHTFAVILQQSPDSHLSRVQSLLSLAQATVLVPAAPLLGRLAATAGTTFTLGAAGAALALVATVALAAPDWRRLGADA
ncbi:MFS transporter [Microlunatus antarcticus]